MSLSSNLSDFVTRAATEIKALRNLINGNAADLSALTTTAKTHLVAAINELKTAVDDLEAGTAGGDMEASVYDPQNIQDDAFARGNHTGTQTAATISDFDTEVGNHTDVAANTAARHTHSNSSVLNATTASFTTADETKLDGIEASADVTDATNVDAAGAVMNSDTSTAAMSFVIDEDNMASNSATKVPTQQSVKAYVDANIAANDAMVFKGVIDCSANPSYPAADRGHTYRVSVAGKIGGSSGPNVQVGDILLCLTDSTASGNHSTVGAQWSIIQADIDGAVTTAEVGDTNADFVATFEAGLV